MMMPENIGSPRRQIFEAKYDKYLANKAQKIQMDSRARSGDREDFDILTLHPGKSPSKNFKNRELQKSLTHKTLD
jgi:hypothetical protein